MEEGLSWPVARAVPDPAGTRVSILIPSAGKTEILDRNLESLWDKGRTDAVRGRDHRQSQGRQQHDPGAICRSAEPKGRPIRQVRPAQRAIQLLAAEQPRCGNVRFILLLFLNDDTEGISSGWLDALAELAVRKEVGAVGAKLLYPDGTIQHAGVTMGLAEICGHSFKGARGRAPLLRFSGSDSQRERGDRGMRDGAGRGFPPRGASMRRLSQSRITISICVCGSGRRGTGFCTRRMRCLYHHEAYSKSEKDLQPHPAETLALKTRWRDVIEEDPYYNPNLTRHKENW